MNQSITHKIKPDSVEFKHATHAMAWGGFSAFSVLYGLQPLMPMLSNSFHLPAASISGVISASTAGLACSLIPASIIARRYGLKKVMCYSLAIAALVTLACAFVHSFTLLLLLRACLGIALGGFPAVAMAYLSEEIEGTALGKAMGFYISGNALGGLLGRFMMAFLGEWFSWRSALMIMGCMSIILAWTFWYQLPESHHNKLESWEPGKWWEDACRHFQDQGLPWLFIEGFLLMGCYVSLYNYLNYRLVAPPFNFKPSTLGMIALMNGVGMFASTWAGSLADRFGRRKILYWMVLLMVLGLVATLIVEPILLLTGVALFTFGFFAAHSLVSSWVGRRAQTAQALASSFYLCAFYCGSSAIGSLTGLFWHYGAWPGVVGFLSFLLIICLGIAVRLSYLRPKVTPH